MVKIVEVELLDPALREHYGLTMRVAEEQAILGEKKGKWRIVQKQSYETRVMEPALPNEILSYKDVFKRQPLTKRVKKKKVAWVQDFSRMGGAELSNREVIKVGSDCGFDISVLTPGNDKAHFNEILSLTDVIILNNIFGFSFDLMNTVLRAIYSDRIPYVKYEHDHRELDRVNFSRKLFQSSKLNVFISPMHLRNHTEKLGCDGICLPLAIDVDLFKSVEGIKRKQGTAVVCNVRHFKSWTNLQKYIIDHQEIQFTVMGKDAQVQGSNVTIREMIPYEKMPELYSEFEYVVHILDGWGAGERVIFEGALCDCKVVANEKVGHVSWEKDLTNKDGLRDWLALAPYAFWKEVDQRIRPL